MFSDEQREEIEQYLKRVEGRVYLGCDSQSFKRFNLKSQRYERWARYAVVLVIHINNSQGCKIFSYRETERVYDRQANKPQLRLMTEVYKTVEAYLALADLLEHREVEIHLDVNPSDVHASSVVVKQAVGYVKGVTNLDALIKPDAWAGSTTADFVVRKKLA
ncbi:MAG: ribonuclease H-like YkuK family protein [Pseudomonadota bacterium]